MSERTALSASGSPEYKIAATVGGIPFVTLAAVLGLVVVVYTIGIGDSWIGAVEITSTNALTVFRFLSLQIAVALVLALAPLSGLVRGSVGALIHIVALALLLEPAAPGDKGHWLWIAQQPVAWLSDAGANAFYNLATRIGDIDYAPPIYGGLTYWVVFTLDRRLRETLWVGDEGRVPWTLILYLHTPLPFLYSYGFVENPQLAIPFLLLAIVTLGECVQGRRGMWAGSALLGVACFVHGFVTFFLPVIPIAAVLRSISRRSGNARARRILRDVSEGTAACAAAIVLCLMATVAVGLELQIGNVTGGEDNLRFVPLRPEDMSFWTRFVMFSMEHLVEFSNIVVFGLPVLVVGPAFLLFRPTKLSSLIGSPVAAFYASWIVGYLAFVFLWNFDLGFPADLDLMLSGSVGALPIGLVLVREILTQTGSDDGLQVALWLAVAVPPWMVISTIIG
jgi:hypothetical protein